MNKNSKTQSDPNQPVPLTPTSLVLRVDHVGLSPNQQLTKHWRVVSQEHRKARAAWLNAVSSLSEEQKRMMTTLQERIKHYGTQSPKPSDSTTETLELGFDMPSQSLAQGLTPLSSSPFLDDHEDL